MTYREQIYKKLEHIIQKRLNLLNGEEFDLWLETKGFTNEIVDTIIDFLQEETVSEDLEGESKEYSNNWYYSSLIKFNDTGYSCVGIQEAFKAGAKWQKEKDNQIDKILEVNYAKGWDACKQLMIKNSIEVKVKSDKDGLFTTETWDEMNELLQKIGTKEGDKVYISIIK